LFDSEDQEEIIEFEEESPARNVMIDYICTNYWWKLVSLVLVMCHGYEAFVVVGRK
jgi:hypothetical protein